MLQLIGYVRKPNHNYLMHKPASYYVEFLEPYNRACMNKVMTDIGLQHREVQPRRVGFTLQ